MIKYPKLKDYAATTVDVQREELLELACCDCGLVHFIKLGIVEDGKVMIAFKSNKRATAQLRRHSYGDLQQGKSKTYKMVAVEPLIKEK